MPWDLIVNVLLIVVARVADVSLGTIRTVSVVQGRRFSALALGFFEVLIWIFVVAKVVNVALVNPAYAIAYALGFALGNFIGITIEERIAVGSQVVKVFSREGKRVASVMREKGFRATTFLGEGRDGPVYQVFIKTDRRRVKQVCAIAREIDPKCFYLIEAVRSSSSVAESDRPKVFSWWPIIRKK